MTCSEAEPLIARAADEDDVLDAEGRATLRAHLASCAGCRDALEGQRATRGALAARPPAPVPPGFATRVMARLEPATDQWTDWMEAVNWRAWAIRLSPVAATLLVAAILGLGSSSRGEPADAVEFTELVTTWVGTDIDAPRTVRLLWQEGMTDETLTDEVLLDVLLPPAPETPVQP